MAHITEELPKGASMQCTVDNARTIHADVIEWLCKNVAVHGRITSDEIPVYGAKVEGILDQKCQTV